MKQSAIMVFIRDLNERDITAEEMFRLCAERFPDVTVRDLKSTLEILLATDGTGE